jgi:hypothetical protein
MAKRHNDSCYTDVIESHSRPARQKRMEAMREAEKKALEQRKKAAEAQVK